MKSKKSPRPAAAAPASPLSHPAAVPPAPPTREQVQALAHAIWTDRGCPHGIDVEIWLEAERQLSGRAGVVPPGQRGESLDPDRSDAARIDREMNRVVGAPEQRSPTSL